MGANENSEQTKADGATPMDFNTAPAIYHDRDQADMMVSIPWCHSRGTMNGETHHPSNRRPTIPMILPPLVLLRTAWTFTLCRAIMEAWCTIHKEPLPLLTPPSALSRPPTTALLVVLVPPLRALDLLPRRRSPWAIVSMAPIKVTTCR